MHFDRQGINQEADEVNGLGQPHIPIIVFSSYLLSLLFTAKLKDMKREVECEKRKTRKVHFHRLHIK